MIYKIYKIECLTTGKIYIGQTRTNMKNRISAHISCFNTKNIWTFCHSYDVFVNNNFTVEVIDEVECDITSEANYNLETFYMKYFN